MKLQGLNIFYRIYKIKYFVLSMLYKKKLEVVFALIDEFSKESGYYKSPELKERIIDLFILINKFKIKNVLEIGSGRTTNFFNYLKKKGIINKVVSLEQDRLFLEKVEKYLNSKEIDHFILHCPFVIENDGHFLNYIPEKNEFDFLYVDGPDDLLKINKYNTYDGRAICKDVVNYIQNNIHPKVIVFDGRISSIIYSRPFLLNYRFFPGIRFSLKFNSFKGKIRLNRHSYFIKK